MCSRPETWPQHGEIVGPAGAATTSGEKPEGKAPAGPGQLQEEIKPLFPGKGGSGEEDDSFFRGNGQRPVQIGRLLPPGAKDGGVDAVGNDGDGIPDRAEEAAARRAIQREQPTTVNRFHPS